MPSSNGAKVELRDLTKIYEGVAQPAVDAINLTVEPGEFLTLLGPSGSGKTTTLNMIAGFEVPSAGAVSINGRNMTTVPTYQRNLGVVFQNYSLFPHLNVVANVAYPLRRRGINRVDAIAKAKDLLQRVQLEAFAERKPKELSGGQQQRVALARALVYDPPLLLLDEPLGALDKNLRESMQQEISDLHRRLGLTFIFVTHDQEEALSMSDRIALFQNGKITQTGSAKTIYQSPNSLFVAKFLGESNIFNGLISSGGPMSELDSQGHRFKGRASGKLQVGDRAHLIVRPESIRIVGPTDAQVGITVTSVTFVGSHCKILGHTKNGEEIALRISSTESSRVKERDELGLSWSPEDAVVVPEYCQ